MEKSFNTFDKQATYYTAHIHNMRKFSTNLFTKKVFYFANHCKKVPLNTRRRRKKTLNFPISIFIRYHYIIGFALVLFALLLFPPIPRPPPGTTIFFYCTTVSMLLLYRIHTARCPFPVPGASQNQLTEISKPFL